MIERYRVQRLRVEFEPSKCDEDAIPVAVHLDAIGEDGKRVGDLTIRLSVPSTMSSRELAPEAAKRALSIISRLRYPDWYAEIAVDEAEMLVTRATVHPIVGGGRGR